MHRSSEARRGVVHSVALIMVVAAGGAGCASRGTAAPAARTEEGTYDFFARAGERTDLRGSLLVLAGSLMLQPENGTCREDLLVVDSEKSRYICDHTSDVENLVFVLDKRYPLTRSVWMGSMRQRRQRTVCAQYAIRTAAGGVRTSVEWYETSQLRGPMTFRPRPVTDLRRSEPVRSGAGSRAPRQSSAAPSCSRSTAFAPPRNAGEQRAVDDALPQAGIARRRTRPDAKLLRSPRASAGRQWSPPPMTMLPTSSCRRTSRGSSRSNSSYGTRASTGFM
jgi:hypothetical protein